MTDIQLGHSLISYYVAAYKNRYKVNPMINKNTAKWAARDIIDSFGFDACKDAVDWYFYVKDSGHEWSWYVSNVEKLIVARKEKEIDDRMRQENRQRARAWLNG